MLFPTTRAGLGQRGKRRAGEAMAALQGQEDAAFRGGSWLYLALRHALVSGPSIGNARGHRHSI